MTAKLLAEKDNPQADVVWGLAATSLLLLKAEDMLEPYAPAGLEETDLFRVKQQFVYTVLLPTLLTDKGKSLVRENEDDRNAQKIIKELVAHHRKSMHGTTGSDNFQEILIRGMTWYDV